MNETREILFALLHCGLHPSQKGAAGRFAHLFAAPRQTPDWKAVYKMSARQGVLAIAWDGLQWLVDEGVIAPERQPDKPLMLQWLYNVQIIEERCRKQSPAIASLAGFYESHGVRMMILKGYGLSLCYPTPEHRPCGDIDIWLYGEQQRGDDLLRREKGVVIDEDKHHHTVFTVEGVMVENHYDFLNVHAHSSNRGLEERLRRLADGRSERVAVGESGIFLPPADFNALFLLRHAASHYAAENIGLRHVADWAMFVERCGGDVDWEGLESTAREYNMHRFLHCLNAMAMECMGVDAGLFPQFGRDGQLERRVLNDILEPEFAESMPKSGILRKNWYRLRRWWANRWKHRIVYREGLLRTFIVQIYSHLLKPRSLK